MKLRVLIADTFDPWFNLATEDWIFNDMDPEYKVLFLWRNQNTVVIGRFQNPWTECRVDDMEKDGIKLARRQSGGGAVFHDLGNTNFTFMSSREGHDKDANTTIITNALKRFGIDASAQGRNDIVVTSEDGPKKVSGSAFKEKKDRAFHHGTLLINADLTKLGNYLNPDQRKLQAKGIKSVKARVSNLVNFNSEINHENLSEAIIEEFFNFYGSRCEIEHLDYDFLNQKSSLLAYYDKLKDWNWRFGETPKFTHELSTRFAWGSMDFHIDSHKGMIKEVKIFSDSLNPQMIESLVLHLKDKRYDRDGVISAISLVENELPHLKEHLNELGDWLISEIS